MQKNIKCVSFETRTGHIVPVKVTQAVVLAPVAYDYRERVSHNAVSSMAVWSPAGLLVGMSVCHNARRVRVKVQEGERKLKGDFPFKNIEGFRMAYATAVETLAEFLCLSDAVVNDALGLTDGLVEAYFNDRGEFAPEQIGDVFYYNGWPMGLQMTSSGRADVAGDATQYVKLRLGRSHAKSFVAVYLTPDNFHKFEERMDKFLKRGRELTGDSQLINAIDASREVIRNEVLLRFNDMARRPVAKKGVARECEEALA